MKHFINVELNNCNVDIDKKVFNKIFNCDIELLQIEVDEFKTMVDENLQNYFRITTDEYRLYRVFDVNGNELEFDY